MRSVIELLGGVVMMMFFVLIVDYLLEKKIPLSYLLGRRKLSSSQTSEVVPHNLYLLGRNTRRLIHFYITSV